jgi:outer membrane protein OmpA-like peptidoglycan-associated protein
VVDQISKRDVLLLVQIYTIRAQGVCLPVAAPAPAPAPIVAPAPPPVVHQLVHAKKTKRGLVFTLGSVLFATNKSNLNENARNSVNELTAYLQDHPTRNIRIEGYTDSTGSKKYNQSLSIRRAKSVEDALLKAGIDKSRMQAKGYGLQFPVATNKTVDGRQLNRRVEVVISDKNGHFLKNR